MQKNWNYLKKLFEEADNNFSTCVSYTTAVKIFEKIKSTLNPDEVVRLCKMFSSNPLEFNYVKLLKYFNILPTKQFSAISDSNNINNKPILKLENPILNQIVEKLKKLVNFFFWKFFKF